MVTCGFEISQGGVAVSHGAVSGFSSGAYKDPPDCAPREVGEFAQISLCPNSFNWLPQNSYYKRERSVEGLLSTLGL